MWIVGYIRRRRIVKRHSIIPMCYYFIKSAHKIDGDLNQLLVEATKPSPSY